MIKRAASGPFGTFCYHVVTKLAEMTKRAGTASNLIGTVVTKRVTTSVCRGEVLLSCTY